jgi:hypothetical protein
MVRVGLPSMPRDLYAKPTSHVGQWMNKPTPKEFGKIEKSEGVLREL